MAERGTAMGAVVFLFQSQSQFSHRVNEDFLRVEDRTVWLRPTHRNTVCVCVCVRVYVFLAQLSVVTSTTCCADLHSERSGMGLLSAALCQ